MSKPSLKINDSLLGDNSAPQRVDVQVTPVFSAMANSRLRFLLLRGGAGSSKSYSICQHLTLKFLQEKKKKILILRKSLPYLRVSTYLMMKEVAKELGVLERIAEEKVLLNWTYKDNLIHFGSLDDPEKIKCYHPDTEILTNKGFVNITKIKKGDMVATMNPATLKAEYASVKKTFVYDYNDYLYSPESATGVRDSHVGFAVTNEHKMIASTKDNRRFRRIKITNLEGKRFYVPRAADWKGSKPKTFTIPKWKDNDDSADKNWSWDDGRKNRTFDIVPWLKFLGWYLSEGSLYSKGWTIIISQTGKNEQNREEIKKVIDELGYKWWDNEDSIYLCGIDLYKYLESLGRYCYEKRIPREVLELDKSLLVHLLDALVKGDGTKNSETNSVYYTTSIGLVDDVSELAIKIGLIPLVRDGKITEYQYDNARPFWIVGITGPNRSKDTAVSKLKKIRYTGKVYCLTVEPYNTVMIRYNNRVMWCGQSSDWSYIWMEEATEFTYRDFMLLKTRLRTKTVDKIPNQMLLSFNPTDESHWIKTELIDKAMRGVGEIHSTYLDNPFLDDDYIADLEEIIKQDRNFYRIYALGEWGKLDNLIYSNWDVVPDLWPDNISDTIFGIDFGYNAPSVLVMIGLKDKDVYEKQLIYKSHLTNQMLIDEMKRVVPVEMRKKCSFYADTAEPDRIEEIKKAGFNIKPANKKIKEGIDFIKMLRVHISESSGDIIKEKRAYSWRTDRKGNVLDEPIGFLDHAQDAERYAIYTHLRGSRDYTIRWLS
jgi:PBSX family phage terminase large subunit